MPDDPHDERHADRVAERAEALALVPFQINPHYVAGAFYTRVDWYGRYGGETRDDRLREFHERNEVPILALREGAILRVEGARARLEGPAGARLYVRGRKPRELAPGTSLSKAHRQGFKTSLKKRACAALLRLSASAS